jgi:hypothetical protein
MLRGAIIIFLVNYCAFLFSQNISYSRPFETNRRNLILSILNNRPDYFYVLRYNRLGHDIVIERRKKPSAEIIAFTALRMDSVNARWFDYENLDYLFFEHNYKTYFLFEKFVNTKKTIYLKIADTIGKAGGFIELASINKDETMTDFNFQFKITNNNKILIVGSQHYVNNSEKKVAMLYDFEKLEKVWVKKLPIENPVTGYSQAFQTNAANDLFYVLVKSRVVSYNRKYYNQMQWNMPVFFYDTLTLACLSNTSGFSIHKTPLLNNLTSLNSLNISAMNNDIVVQAHYALQELDKEKPSVYFLAKRLDANLQNEYYVVTTPLNKAIEEALIFYDGTDNDLASTKEYKFISAIKNQNQNYSISQRQEAYYYKELLVWQTDLSDGRVTSQYLIPRKIYSFKNRTRFKNIGEVMPVFYKDKPAFIVLEATANLKRQGLDFNFNRFKKETNLWRANLVMYGLSENNELTKNLIYHNTTFDIVPIKYQASYRQDVVLYMTSGKIEKFVILRWNQP